MNPKIQTKSNNDIEMETAIISHYNNVNTNEYSNSQTDSNKRYNIPGYDTISYWVEQYDVPEIDLLAEISCKMKDEQDGTTHSGQTYIEGYIDEIYIRVFQNGIIISVSLPKLILGKNVETIYLDEVKTAHEKISSILGFSIYRAKVTRIDVSSTFIMLHPFDKYLTSLGSISRFNEKPFDNGRYYFNRNKFKSPPVELLFYDKLMEQGRKGIPVNVNFNNSFRYEIRFRQLKRTLKRGVITPSDLEDLNFFQMLVGKWEKYFNKISINRELRSVEVLFKNKKTMFNYLASKGLRTEGPEKLIKEINELLLRKGIKKQQGYNLKRKIKDLLNNDELTVENVCAIELQEKINDAVFYTNNL